MSTMPRYEVMYKVDFRNSPEKLKSKSPGKATFQLKITAQNYNPIAG